MRAGISSTVLVAESSLAWNNLASELSQQYDQNAETMRYLWTVGSPKDRRSLAAAAARRYVRTVDQLGVVAVQNHGVICYKT